MAKPGTDVATVDGTVVPGSESVELVPIHEVRESLLTGREVEVADPDAVMREIAMQLMDADTPEALFAVPGTTKPADILGERFTLTEIRFMPSTIEDARVKVYALMTLVDKDGVPRKVPCGGQALMVQCLRAKEEGWLPWDVMLVEAGQKRAARNRPIYLQTWQG